MMLRTLRLTRAGFCPTGSFSAGSGPRLPTKSCACCTSLLRRLAMVAPLHALWRTTPNYIAFWLLDTHTLFVRKGRLLPRLPQLSGKLHVPHVQGGVLQRMQQGPAARMCALAHLNLAVQV